jgi:stearoyl-CoA desaturase (delta-9 desaturase)
LLFGVFYLLTGLGITVGYHRLFTHSSFETKRPVKYIFAVLGSMAVEGSLFDWCARHRNHHAHSDKEGDNHSPNLHGKGFVNLLKGLWFAHTGWFIQEKPPAHKGINDLQKDPGLCKIDKLFPLWAVLTLLLPTVLGGLLSLSWMGALTGLLWGGLARVFLVHHATWSVNSICHVFGSRPFKTNDLSTNNWIVGILALGEGYHNFHHAAPRSARHGVLPFEFDISYYVIKGLEVVGLASNVQVPNAEKIQKLRAE